ncbi:MAG TPA: biopolymer transporter ExbD [Bacteroidales bacterium]|nr:biopolymer transporter ExbD [Bacteroidales bacterium]
MRNKRSIEFSTASMSDLVFLLLIFFMLTSTLISPNAIKLLLPSSNSKTMAKQTITIYVNENLQMYLETRPVDLQSLQILLEQKLQGQTDASIVLKADKSVPVQEIVSIIDVVNAINDKYKTKHKIILATKPLK